MRRRAERLPLTIYPETDHMGESDLHRRIADGLRDSLERFLAPRGVFYVGANQFFYFERGDTSARTAPDVYVLRDISPSRLARSWRAWELREPPVFCFEIVSSDSLKDYEEAPVAQAKLGTSELVVFDPEARGHRGRNTWRVHRRRSGGLYLVSASDEDRIRSEALGCWLRVVGRGDARRIRVATGRGGDAVLPTVEEERDAERAEKERERAEKERERAEKERERAEKERERAARAALEAEVARLRKRLLRKRPPA